MAAQSKVNGMSFVVAAESWTDGRTDGRDCTALHCTASGVGVAPTEVLLAFAVGSDTRCVLAAGKCSVEVEVVGVRVRRASSAAT